MAMVIAQATVLVVDDAAEVRSLIALLLEEEGYGVVARSRAEDALDEVARACPDLVVLDLRLPGMSGLECHARLRASAHTAALPILLLSAAIDDVSRLASILKDGRTSVLAKPFDLDVLLAAIRDLLAASPC